MKKIALFFLILTCFCTGSYAYIYDSTKEAEDFYKGLFSVIVKNKAKDIWDFGDNHFHKENNQNQINTELQKLYDFFDGNIIVDFDEVIKNKSFNVSSEVNYSNGKKIISHETKSALSFYLTPNILGENTEKYFSVSYGYYIFIEIVNLSGQWQLHELNLEQRYFDKTFNCKGMLEDFSKRDTLGNLYLSILTDESLTSYKGSVSGEEVKLHDLVSDLKWQSLSKINRKENKKFYSITLYKPRLNQDAKKFLASEILINRYKKNSSTKNLEDKNRKGEIIAPVFVEVVWQEGSNFVVIHNQMQYGIFKTNTENLKSFLVSKIIGE